MSIYYAQTTTYGKIKSLRQLTGRKVYDAMI